MPMARVKRPVFLFFTCQDHPFLDVEQLLRGVVEPASLQRVYGLSAAVGGAVPLTEDELRLIVSLPSDEWVESDDDRVRELADRGLVLRDGEDEVDAERRRRDELLGETGWNQYAALFHFLTRWQGIDLRASAPGGEAVGELPPVRREDLEHFLAERGSPPPAFHPRPPSGEVTELPLVERDGGIFDLLPRRKTTRSFDGERPLPLDELSVVLRSVFGVHGSATALPGVVTLKRTSPSGGGLHPVEAYLLVANVDGLRPGLYRYLTKEHGLELLEALASRGDAYRLATSFMCGQTYFGSAHVLVVLAARFERNHWKYSAHDKAYPAILMDAAHLSQTLYLVAAELGLGAFVTAAVNAVDVDERLGLDGYREGSLAICGLGTPAAEASPFDPTFEPYDPTSARA
jgi:putative peptide maturation dehydrogenase